MTTGGGDFLEDWIDRTITADMAEADVGKLAAKLLADGAAAGFTLPDMELDQETAEDYIREAIAHLAEPGTPGE